ncbi:unnamed protein product [Mytilus coruscus]|uniref:Integrase zinc-binding domain-containing protein n=1 Tax=Mytilus coruscus TaxID=42192 RepID=A0A6J8DNN2_MYTCO|nr:unnamed protein product [Mytilus coruscus]
MRWVVKYKSGRSNVNADVLSRNSLDVESNIRQIVQSSSLNKLRECGNNRNNVQHIHINQINLTDQIETMSIFPEYTTDEIRQLQSSENVLSVVLNFVEQGKLTTEMLTKQSKPVKKLLRKFDSLLIENGILYRKISDIECGECKQLVKPETLKHHVLETLHNLSGHQGTERTLALLYKRCYWSDMVNDEKHWIKTCERCLIAKNPLPKVRPSMGSLLAFADGSGPVRNVTRREICDTGKVDMMQNSNSDITEDSNSSFGGWNVTYIDPNLLLIQLEHQESEDEQDVTTASVDMTPPPFDADSSRRKSKRTIHGKHSNPFNLSR